MEKTIDLKSTLNLPKTDFPMKARLPEREPEQLTAWEQMGLYRRILESRAGARLFVLHDGPPYPTGEIHLGTGLNKILKDMIVKSKTMAGFRSPYIPGWDCHGLPIETQVEKELGGKTTKVAPSEFRRMCREFAARYVETHKREFKRLGIFGQWDRPYLTMDPNLEAAIAGAFIDFFEKGLVYRGLKPVYWCIYDRTALAEAEVEYEDHTSPSIWVRYPVAEVPQPLTSKGGFYAVVWTTTPWTLPASMALAFNGQLQYVLAEDANGDVYIVAEQLIDNVAAATGLRFTSKAGPFAGATFAAAKFKHPFLDRTIPGVLGDHVTLEQGSGIVHTAPGHGAEDFRTGQEYGLETYAPIDDEGRFTEGPAAYKGKKVFEANSSIIELLRERGTLLAEKKISHSYPHCWRCHNPVIFRATEQWFIHMDSGTATIPAPKAPALRRRALDEIDKVKWLPEWGRDRMREMIAERPDWCISRQRFWGVPLVIFYCDACDKQLKDFSALRHVLDFFKREGADAWYTHSAQELLPAGTKCSCGAAKWRKERDILDVWFESGSTHLAVLNEQNGLKWPADVYLEGPDQFRGWFQSSLLIGVGIRGRAPYAQVVTHGWTLDEKGAPMSKSLGNALYPNEIVDKWGADLLRVWVVSQDYTADMRNSPAMMTQLAEAYRKIRNTFRFALSNLFDFDPARHSVPDAELWEMDAWMLRETGKLLKQCAAWYANFEFHRAYHAIHDFCTVDLSAFYFDVLKDRLYTFAPNNRGRRSAQTAVYRIASALVRLIAPVLAFTAEEVWKHLPRAAGDPESVHMSSFPVPEDFENAFDEAHSKNWDRLLAVRQEVLKALEPARAAKTISASLEARVTLDAAGKLAELLHKHAAQLPALFIVSQVEIESHVYWDSLNPNIGLGDALIQDLRVSVERALGSKCERCWNYSTRVGESAAYPTLCERCLAALAEIERDGGALAGSARS
jgi:isoleucyl-tRNA synthetase